jgi:hypothetical protein
VVFGSDPKGGDSINSSVSLENLPDVQWRFDHSSLYGLLDMKRHPIAERLDTGLDTYLAEIGQIPLLTTEQEHALPTKSAKEIRARKVATRRSDTRAL